MIPGLVRALLVLSRCRHRAGRNVHEETRMTILLSIAMILLGLTLFGLFHASIGYFDGKLKG